jgi:hypothetical protein
MSTRTAWAVAVRHDKDNAFRNAVNRWSQSIRVGRRYRDGFLGRIFKGPNGTHKGAILRRPDRYNGDSLGLTGGILSAFDNGLEKDRRGIHNDHGPSLRLRERGRYAHQANCRARDNGGKKRMLVHLWET